MKSKVTILTAGLFIVAGTAPVTSLGASETNEQLKERIQQLEQQLRRLEEKFDSGGGNSAANAKAVPTVTLGSSGLNVRSADTNFWLRIGAHVQADGRFYLDSPSAGKDTFLLRKVRPVFEGTVFQKFDYRMLLDFGSGLSATPANIGFVQEAFVNARFRPELQLQIGKFKEPVGLERLQPDVYYNFMEKGHPTQLVPNRDVGVQLQGDLFRDRLSYAVGVFNGVADGSNGDFETTDGDKDVSARLFSHPFKLSGWTAFEKLGLGIAGTIGKQNGVPRSFITPGQQPFFSYRTGTGAAPNVISDGEHWRIVPQGYYYAGPFGLLAEYVISQQEVRQAGGGTGSGLSAAHRQSAWQVVGSWFLTGETNSFKGVQPNRPLGDGLGGWEVVARVGQLDVDDASFPIFASPASSADRAISWGIGLNWHINRALKASVNYEQTELRGKAGYTSPDSEQVLMTRMQLAF